LAALSSGLDNRDAHVILPETISEEPLGPVVPHGDEQWFDVVKTVMGILVYGEAYGVTSGNLPPASTGDTKVDRLLGFEGSYGQESLGISQTAAQDVIRTVGNYGEIYDRHLTPLGVTRAGSRNDLWINGGEIYSAPLR
jgi:general L-amino acid transport system substrate-binding protein